MADVGSIVADSEVTALIPAIKSIDVRAKLIIQGAERSVTRYCKRTFSATTVAYTSERVDIEPGELVYNEQITVPRLAFRLKNYPVTKFNSLKQVTARNPTTGEPTSEGLLLIPRDCYTVDVDTGYVHLLRSWPSYTPWTLMNAGLQSSWPTGIDVMRANYEAGVAEANAADIADLKLIVLRVIGRLWHQFETQSMNVTGSNGEFGTINFINVILTAEEKTALTPFRKWITC